MYVCMCVYTTLEYRNKLYHNGVTIESDRETKSMCKVTKETIMSKTSNKSQQSIS